VGALADLGAHGELAAVFADDLAGDVVHHHAAAVADRRPDEPRVGRLSVGRLLAPLARGRLGDEHNLAFGGLHLEDTGLQVREVAPNRVGDDPADLRGGGMAERRGTDLVDHGVRESPQGSAGTEESSRCQRLTAAARGRGDWIRTSDLLNPILRYEAPEHTPEAHKSQRVTEMPLGRAMFSVPNMPHIPNRNHYKNHYKTCARDLLGYRQVYSALRSWTS